MDYKIIILLIAVLLLVILIYRQISGLKTQVSKNMQGLSIQFRNDITNKIQTSMNKYIGQIKEISAENIQQLKKISLLNNQPITKKMNHFTETDESEFGTNIKCLSDITQKIKNFDNNKIFEKSKKEGSVYYMSEETVNSGSKPILLNSIKLPETPRPQDDLPLYDKSRNDSPSEEIIPVYIGVKQKENSERDMQSTISNKDESVEVATIEDQKSNSEKSKQSSQIKIGGLLKTEDNMGDLHLIETQNKEPDETITKEPEVEKQTIKIDTDNITLSDIGRYTFNELRRLAKSKNIPIKHNVNNKSVFYKKDELYSVIKDKMLTKNFIN